jgi:hypothetical protein
MQFGFASSPSTSAFADGGSRRNFAVSVTRKRKDGRTERIPPPHLDWGYLRLAGDGQSRVNYYHHPQNYLLPEEEDDEDDES